MGLLAERHPVWPVTTTPEPLPWLSWALVSPASQSPRGAASGSRASWSDDELTQRHENGPSRGAVFVWKPSSSPARKAPSVILFPHSPESPVVRSLFVVLSLSLAGTPAPAGRPRTAPRCCSACTTPMPASGTRRSRLFRRPATPTPGWRPGTRPPRSRQLRIDVAPLDSMKTILFRADSIYQYDQGKISTTQPMIHPLMVLGFDVYAAPVSQSAAELTSLASTSARSARNLAGPEGVGRWQISPIPFPASSGWTRSAWCSCA